MQSSARLLALLAGFRRYEEETMATVDSTEAITANGAGQPRHNYPGWRDAKVEVVAGPTCRHHPLGPAPRPARADDWSPSSPTGVTPFGRGGAVDGHSSSCSRCTRTDASASADGPGTKTASSGHLWAPKAPHQTALSTVTAARWPRRRPSQIEVVERGSDESSGACGRWSGCPCGRFERALDRGLGDVGETQIVVAGVAP
jgi:hypothetical protein